MNILSIFDGMSCGQIALNRVGVKYNKYFASEIDKYAIQVTQKNYPDTIQLGSVVDVKAENLPKIDLLLGGSPCQGFSFAGKQLNFEDPRSKLFFEYVRILKDLREANPHIIFLLENVRMKKEYQDVISECLGVEPIEINSALVSAQNRKRLYWTNIPNVTQPKDKGIMLKDIVHEETDFKTYGLSDKLIDGFLNSTSVFKDRFQPSSDMNKKGRCLTARYFKLGKTDQYIIEELTEYMVPFDKTLQILDKEVEKGKVGYFRKDSQANRFYFIHNKAVTLCGDAGGGAAKMGQYLFGSTKKNSQGDRVYQEDEKSPTLNASSGGTAGRGNLLFGCITPDRINKRQNGQRFNEGKKFYTLTAQDRHGILVEGYIRKLTPIECERLQTVPDNHTNHVSNSQRYKMLGNGWTIDVIAHIFKQLKMFGAVDLVKNHKKQLKLF